MRDRVGTWMPWKFAPVAKFFAVGLCLALGTLSPGCSDDETTAPPDELAPPSNLTYLNGDGSVTLDWNASPDIADADGYVVYRDTDSMVGEDLAVLNATKKLTTTPLTSTSFTDNTATNGVKYFYAVRLQDGSDFSEPTSEINTASRVQTGSHQIAEFASPNASGFDLSTGQVFAMSSSGPDNRPTIDLYLGTDSATDQTSAALAIKSPHLVLNSDPDWTARNADLKLLDNSDDPTTSDSGWSEKIVLGSTSAEIVGKVIAIRTPAEGNGSVYFAKIRIDSVTGTAGNRTITVTRAYQSLPNYIRFEVPTRP
ncbi:MAG: hypothetical protein IPK72_06485 [Candidatus Eisenbacteria bacterium]|nr:hypothetical protein [Candidatus Eisenbacteria bacterium]